MFETNASFLASMVAVGSGFMDGDMVGLIFGVRVTFGVTFGFGAGVDE